MDLRQQRQQNIRQQLEGLLQIGLGQTGVVDDQRVGEAGSGTAAYSERKLSRMPASAVRRRNSSSERLVSSRSRKCRPAPSSEKVTWLASGEAGRR